MNKWERIPIYLILSIVLALVSWIILGKKSYKKLTIVNRYGKPVILLATTEMGSGTIRIYNEHGNSIAMLGRSGLSLYNLDGKEHVWIGPRPGENLSGGIELFDNQRQLLTKIGARKHGGFVDLYSHDGKALASLGGMGVPVGDTYEQVSAGGLITYGFLEKPIAAFGITKKGKGSLTLWDEYQNPYFQYPLEMKK